MRKSEIINGKRLIKELKQMEKAVENSKELQENHLFEREIRELIKTASGQFFFAVNNVPLLGAEVAELGDINDENVKELVLKQLQVRYIGENDINSLLWQSKLCVIRNALKDNKVSNGCSDKYIKQMYALKDLDMEEIEKLSPIHSAFSFDDVYNASSPETKAMYRRRTALIARSAGFEEERYTRELVKRAVIDDLHIGEVIETDYRNVFPYAGADKYFIWLLVVTVLISVGIGLLTRLWLIPVVLLPVFAVVKPLADMTVSRFSRSEPLPRMDIKDSLPDNGKVLCVISALVSDINSLKDALTRLRTAKLKNPSEGIEFALLCDLSAGKKEVEDGDGELFDKAEELREEIFPESVIFFRRRTYSKTMRKWQGFDRKRGAVEELAEFVCGKDIDFAFVSGRNAESLRGCEFIAALDLDTVPLMDSIKELAAIALHPLNKEYGIIAPRCTSTLDSTLKTSFSRAMAGNGGVSGISSYDNISGEFYFDCFGEGIFGGKGLIRAKAFLSACKGKFPAERVLSHDILEGGLTGVAYAGDVEFSDSFPPSSKSFFKRAHRWIRGDFQNLRFIFKKEFSSLTRFKLFDNFRRGINPVLILALFFLSCFVRNGFVAAITAYLALLMPFLPSIVISASRGFAFGITRRFYSPIVSETAQLALKALMEIMTLPKAAVISLDAGVKTLWRNLVTKRNLLEWTTSGFLEKTAFKGGAWHLLPSFAVSLGLLACCFFGKAVVVLPGALIMCFSLPMLAYADRPAGKGRTGLNAEAQKELLLQAEKMWSFYTVYVNEEGNWLPPDNVQFYPVFRICARTSPTNIGMYLLSAAAVYELGIIDGENFIKIVENSVESVEKLHKWRGNLFNWYDIKTLKPVSGFVSSVDSGNFIACLIAVKECLRIHGLSAELVQRCNDIIENTGLSEFYCKKRKLFSIGYDTEEEKLSPHRYDMLMSEARLMSYVAIAAGQAPKAHWRALSRTMSRIGHYAGAIAWTGTMFEFYMPELLLTSKEGSMSYEALRYAFHCQKQAHCPFGISESGYYAFDRDLNYQYKAHGVQKTALKAGMNKECVVSPYSSYLTLSAYPPESWNNLVRLEKEGAFNPDFGFYEAVDYTKERVGGSRGAVVKSHMAHHVGMSIAGAANALKDNICSRLFLNDERMKRAEELLEEKVMSGEKVLKITDYHYDDGKNSPEREEITEQRSCNSPINTLCGGRLSLFTSANGMFCGSFKGLQTVNRSADYLERPAGAFYGCCDEKKLYPFFYHPAITGSEKLKTVFCTEETEYIVDEKNFRISMSVKADGRYNGEIRRFSLTNKTRSRRQLTLCAYSEPTLAFHRDYNAHPMFMDLFLKIGYDKDSKLFLFYRKERHGDKVTACAAGFLEDTDFTYCLSKEDCISRLPFSFFKKALIHEQIDRSVPDPCLFIRSDITLDPGREHSCTLFYCYGDSVEAAKRAALELRETAAYQEEGSSAPSPLSLNTLHGRLAAKALPALLYGDAADKRILDARRDNKLNKQALWRYGISGDNPLIVGHWSEGEASVSVLAMMKQGLDRCGISSDLIVLCDNALEKKQAEASLRGLGYALVKGEIGGEMVTLIYALAVAIDAYAPFNEGVKEKQSLPVIACSHRAEENGFTEKGFVIGNEENTWCNVLANSEFGTILSQNSLGFTWAINSRENKLTPWSNDIIRDNYGEALLLKSGTVYYDLIRGSRAEFSPYSCQYYGTVPGVDCLTEVKVYTKGLGKEVSLTLTNTSDTDKRYELVYKIIPVMGGDKEAAMPVAFIEGGGLVVENSQNPYFSGKTVLYCSRKASYCFSQSDIASGSFSYAPKEAEKHFCETAAAIVPLKLPPREKLRIRFILGYYNASEGEGSAANVSVKAVDYVKGLEGSPCGSEFENSIQIACPNGRLNSLFNIWLPHQVIACRLWARSGFFQNGGAFGFRDQLQDCLAAMYFSPKLALEHILRCCQSQFPEGDVLHWWHELKGKRIGVRTRYSDDLLWLPYVACEYWAAFGDDSYWLSEAEYCTGNQIPEDKQELFMEAEGSGTKASLYEHCKAAMEKGFDKGSRGLIKIGCGDWNDGYNNVGIRGEGESVWLSMFYVMCGRKFAIASRQQGDGDYAEKLEKRIAELCVSIEENCWDGDQYLRAFYDDGRKMGSSENSACSIDLLPQAFATLCELPDAERCATALNSAWDRLVDKKNGIIKLFTPAFTEENTEERPGYVMSYPQGIRENGGQYTHAAVWYCLACFKAGQRDRAMTLLDMLNPAYKGGDFGREPYFMTADIYTNPQCYGRGGWSMYTGAAAWYWRCIFEGLFGAEVRKGVLAVNPNLPPEYSGAVLKFNGVSVRFVYAEGAARSESTIRLDGSVKEAEVYYG